MEIPLETDRDLDFLKRDLNSSLKLIEDALGVIVSTRGNKVFIQGDDDKVGITQKLILDIYNLKREGCMLRTEDIVCTLNNLKRTGHINLRDVFAHYIPVASKVRYVIPKTETQMAYIDAIRGHDIVVGIGPAGTGKTYIAMAMAIHAYMKKQVSRIILARPAVEAGERLGFLPGDIQEKVHPYLRPLYDALYDMMDSDKAAVLIEKGLIEIAPLAYMRGRTLKDAFVILDEAQNTTTEQMKMYLTRLGVNSRTVITGDVTQIDLPADRASGLVEIGHVLRGIEGIRFVYFNDKDVVRHKLVQEIIKAYERHEKRED
ncbi:PhoH family protein [Candidatus Magnetobacterium casense]|uniref:PhoH family protein n=1 Tax=Candidatus Magnetobacterium casense TaxID=1455061 RepID=UPI0009E019C5|nr:PhoH family protein [Candidatus Magnetobacterium casensis]